MIMKSNESESGYKTKLTNKLTNKTNVEQMLLYILLGGWLLLGVGGIAITVLMS